MSSCTRVLRRLFAPFLLLAGACGCNHNTPTWVGIDSGYQSDSEPQHGEVGLAGSR
jgi:hypothetical protein